MAARAALLLVITLGKALPVTGLGLLDGQQPSTALRGGTLIGQSGEFSFVLASAGLAVGAVTSETFSLAMGAVVLDPDGRAAVRPRAAHRPSPRYRSGGFRRQRSSRPSACAVTPWSSGSAGRARCRRPRSRGFAGGGGQRLPRRAREALANDLAVIGRDAGTPSVLDLAGVSEAHAMIITTPDALATRQAVIWRPPGIRGSRSSRVPTWRPRSTSCGGSASPAWWPPSRENSRSGTRCAGSASATEVAAILRSCRQA